jgi:hypothetical protein
MRKVVEIGRFSATEDIMLRSVMEGLAEGLSTAFKGTHTLKLKRPGTWSVNESFDLFVTNDADATIKYYAAYIWSNFAARTVSALLNSSNPHESADDASRTLREAYENITRPSPELVDPDEAMKKALEIQSRLNASECSTSRQLGNGVIGTYEFKLDLNRLPKNQWSIVAELFEQSLCDGTETKANVQDDIQIADACHPTDGVHR